jgi:hypothetical protein
MSPLPTPADMVARVDSIRVSLHALHQDIASRRDRRLAANRSAQRGAATSNFTIGDFVLMADVKGKITHDKLLCEWIGPYRITACPRPYIYTLQSLLTPATRDAHATRIKFYADAALNVSEALLTNVGNQGLVFDIDAIVSHRLTERDKFEVLVRWAGFSTAENTWEPLDTIAADAPVAVEAYVLTLSTAESDLLRGAMPRLRREEAV